MLYVAGGLLIENPLISPYVKEVVSFLSFYTIEFILYEP